MALMSAELYDALLDAGASETKARHAAEAAASGDTRFGALEGRMVALEGRMAGLEGRMQGLEGRMQGLEGRMTMIMWMVGISITLTLFGFSAMLGLLWKLVKP